MYTHTHTFLSWWHLAYAAEQLLVHCCCTTTAGNASAASNKLTCQQFPVRTRMQHLSPSSDLPQEDWQLGAFHALPKIFGWLFNIFFLLLFSSQWTLLIMKFHRSQKQNIWLSWEENWEYLGCFPINADVLLLFSVLLKCYDFLYFNVISVDTVQYRVQT